MNIELGFAYCLGVSVCTAAALGGGACAADRGASSDDGGGGNAATVIDCTSNLTGTDNLISDFEDGTGAVVQAAGRNGAWYGYNDQSATCMENPAQGAMNVPATALETPRCGSHFAFRMKGDGCTTWGAGMGTDLAAPLPSDGGAGDAATGGAVPRKNRYDLSGYQAISFWGRVGTGSTTAVHFKLPMLADTKIADGGLCSLSELGTDKCSDDWGRFLTFTTAWKMFTVPLVADPTGLSTEPWGKIYPLDLTDIAAIQFQIGAGSAFDIWIDDVRLTPK